MENREHVRNEIVFFFTEKTLSLDTVVCHFTGRLKICFQTIVIKITQRNLIFCKVT